MAVDGGLSFASTSLCPDRLGLKPLGNFNEIWLRRCDAERELFQLRIGRGETIVVHLEKQSGCRNADPLVSVDERMVSGETVHEHGGFGHHLGIELCIAECSLWTGESRL